MERVELSYYENNKTINLLSKKIVITDDKGSLFTLPENRQMDIDETERRKQENIKCSSKKMQELLYESDDFEVTVGTDSEAVADSEVK